MSEKAPLPDVDRIEEALRQVIDPEVGINIVDLGLVYGVEIAPGQVGVEMTMTTPACPMTAYLTDAVTQAIQQYQQEPVDVTVKLVWDPPWHQGMMSDEAKAHFGWHPGR